MIPTYSDRATKVPRQQHQTMTAGMMDPVTGNHNLHRMYPRKRERERTMWNSHESNKICFLFTILFHQENNTPSG